MALPWWSQMHISFFFIIHNRIMCISKSEQRLICVIFLAVAFPLHEVIWLETASWKSMWTKVWRINVFVKNSNFLCLKLILHWLSQAQTFVQKVGQTSDNVCNGRTSLSNMFALHWTNKISFKAMTLQKKSELWSRQIERFHHASWHEIERIEV